ncbi:hypothetical protein [Microbispora sp. NPDC049633]|uniref:hypothetical protein n=1 Tax=Microbispora sp. NPDC049633 TaxID=3154355 RepID=UPI00341E5149
MDSGDLSGYSAEHSQAHRFLMAVGHEYPEPLHDLGVLEYMVMYVESLREDLSMAEEMLGLWVWKLVEEDHYLGSTIARVLDTPSGEVAVTRIKKKYRKTYERMRAGERIPALRLIDDTIALAEQILADDRIPCWARDRHKGKLVHLYDFRKRVSGQA